MSTLYKTGQYYVIKYTSSSKNPNEKKLYYNRKKYRKSAVEDIKRKCDELYKKGEFDPWRQKVPSMNVSDIYIKEAVEEYFIHKKGDWSNHTSSVNKVVLQHFVQCTGDILVAQLTANDVNKFINRSSLKLESRKSHKTRLNTFVRWLNKNEKTKIDISEIKVNKMECNPPDIIRYFREEELKKLIEGIKQSVKSDIEKGYQKHDRNSLWLCDLIWWQYKTGLRIGETLRLRVSDYDAITKEIRVGHEKAKTKAANNVRMPIHGIKHLNEIVERYSKGKKPEDLLFGRVDVKRTNRTFKKYTKKYLPDKEHLSIHDLRHTCCIELLRRNVSPYKVMKWMRHSSIKTTMQYADALNMDLGNDVAEAWNGMG